VTISVAELKMQTGAGVIPEDRVLEVFIVGEVNKNNYATIYDLAGRQLTTVRLMESARNSFRVESPDRGIYLVRVSGPGFNGIGRVFIE
jgi:hypothetical protein